MIAFLILFLHVLVSPFKTQARLEAEIMMLRHQLNVLRRRVPSKPRLAVADRLLFVWLYRLFPSVLNAVAIVQPETIVRWHRSGLPPLLALEVARSWRTAKSSDGDPPPDPGDELGQPAVGCAAHPRRTAQARDRGRAVDGRQVHGEEWARAVADLEDLSAQPCGRHRRDGLPDRADSRLSVAFRLGHPQARTAAADITERNGPSHGGVDRPSDHRCVPLG